MFLKHKKNIKGQAVLIVLLSLSVVLIVVLYIMSRSVTDISLSTKEEDSLRAFSAAEAGVERALVIGNSSGTIDSANFNANVTSFARGATEVVYPLSLKSGENATFWFSRSGEGTHFTGSQIKYCWGDLGTSITTAETPALEVTIFYTTTPNNLTTLRIARATLDPNTSRRGTNSFGVGNDSTCTIGTDQFEFQSTLNMASLGISGFATANVLQYSTAKILYNITTAHKIGIDVNGTGSSLPSQGSKIISDGSFGNSNRKVEVYQLHPEAPPIFANAIFSTSGIVK
ncbi:MAG: hypothetical protein AAB778_01990 [Patescibacteria group bacterium]